MGGQWRHEFVNGSFVNQSAHMEVNRYDNMEHDIISNFQAT